MFFDEKKWRQFSKIASSPGPPNKVLLKRIKSKKTVLNELSDYAHEEVENRMIDRLGSDTSKPLDEYSFGHMFGENPEDAPWRVAFPLVTGEQKIAVEMMSTLRNSGWVPDFKKKEIDHTYTVNVGTQESPIKQKRKRKEIRYDLHVKKESEYEIPKGPRAGEKTVKKERRKISQALNALLQNKEIDEQQYERYLEFLNEKLEYYTKTNPEELEYIPPNSVIMTRHPIDIARMSDFPGEEVVEPGDTPLGARTRMTGRLTSCHTEDSSHWHCALKEAEGGHGFLAFVVKTEDLKDIDLQAKEIFGDENRDIPGPVPIGRVRLRRYYNTDENYELALPEKRTYGDTPPGFLELVRDWSLETQKDYLEENASEFTTREMEDGTTLVTESPDMDSFELSGGEWVDTKPASDLFNTFFDTDQYHGEIGGANEMQQLLEEYTQAAETLQHNADSTLEHASVYHEVEEPDDWGAPPYVMYSGEMTLEFDASDWIKFPGDGEDWQVRRKLGNDLESELEDHLEELYIDDIDVTAWEKPVTIRTPGSEGTIRRRTVDVRIMARNEYYELNPEGFEGFIDDLQRGWDSNYTAAVEAARSVFIEQGYIEPSKYDLILQDFIEQELDFKNFFVDTEGRKMEMSFSEEGKKIATIAKVNWRGRTTVNFEDIFEKTLPGARSKKTAWGLNSPTIDEEILAELKSKREEAKKYAEKQLELFPGMFPEKADEFDIFPFIKFHFKGHIEGFSLDLDSKLTVNLDMSLELDRKIDDDLLMLALATLKYFDIDKNLEEIVDIAKVAFAKRLAKYEVWRKEDEEFIIRKKKVKTEFLLKVIKLAQEVSYEDAYEAYKKFHDSRPMEDRAPAHQVPFEEYVKQHPHISEMLEEKRRVAENTANALHDFLNRNKPTVVTTGPRAHAETTWEDLPMYVLFGNTVSAHIATIVYEFSFMKLSHVIPEDKSHTITAKMGPPVPAKRNVYEERAEKLMQEIFNM